MQDQKKKQAQVDNQGNEYSEQEEEQFQAPKVPKDMSAKLEAITAEKERRSRILQGLEQRKSVGWCCSCGKGMGRPLDYPPCHPVEVFEGDENDKPENQW